MFECSRFLLVLLLFAPLLGEDVQVEEVGDVVFVEVGGGVGGI